MVNMMRLVCSLRVMVSSALDIMFVISWQSVCEDLYKVGKLWLMLAMMEFIGRILWCVAVRVLRTIFVSSTGFGRCCLCCEKVRRLVIICL